jgi:hypothetical protein
MNTISETTKEKLDFLEKSLRSLFHGRKNRSPQLGIAVKEIVHQLVFLYERILEFSPANHKDANNLPDNIPPSRYIDSLVQTYANLENLDSADPFFHLLEWVSKTLITFIESREKLGVLKEYTQDLLFCLIIVEEKVRVRLENFDDSFSGVEREEPINVNVQAILDENARLTMELEKEKKASDQLWAKSLALEHNWVKAQLVENSMIEICQVFVLQVKMVGQVELSAELEKFCSAFFNK